MVLAARRELVRRRAAWRVISQSAARSWPASLLRLALRPAAGAALSLLPRRRQPRPVDRQGADDGRRGGRCSSRRSPSSSAFRPSSCCSARRRRRVGQLLRSYLDILPSSAACIIIVMGLHFLGVFRIGFLHRQARVEVRNHPAGPLGSYVMGLAFGFGWTPCIGPVLAAILGRCRAPRHGHERARCCSRPIRSASAAVPRRRPVRRALHAFMQRFRGHVGKVEKAMGALLVVTGVLFVTGQITHDRRSGCSASSPVWPRSADRSNRRPPPNRQNFGHDAGPTP